MRASQEEPVISVLQLQHDTDVMQTDVSVAHRVHVYGHVGLRGRLVV